MAHLWAGGPKNPPPWQYVELVLCRDVYHCTPAELDAQDFLRVREHLICLAVENEVYQARHPKKR